MSSHERVFIDGVEVVGVRAEMAPYLQPDAHADKSFPGEAIFEAQPETKELIDIWLEFCEGLAARDVDSARDQTEALWWKLQNKTSDFFNRYPHLDRERWDLAACLAADWMHKHPVPELLNGDTTGSEDE